MTKTKRKTEKFSDETLDALLAGRETPEEIFGEDGLFKRLQSALIERALGAELTHHLGYPPHGPAAGDDRRNGHGAKTVETETGPLAIRVPRDRDGDFTPQLVKKGQRRLEGFDDKVLSLYAQGMSMREIRTRAPGALSPELISTVTDAVLDEVRSWQNRPLESHYPIVYLRAFGSKSVTGGILSPNPSTSPSASPWRAKRRLWASGSPTRRGRNSGSRDHRPAEPGDRGYLHRLRRWSQGFPRSHRHRLPRNPGATLYRPHDPTFIGLCVLAGSPHHGQ